MASTKDPQLALLERVSERLRGEYSDKISEWEGSPFEWLKTQSSSRRGRICEQMVSGWLRDSGFEVRDAPGREADLIVAGRRVEVKSSTRWESGIYKFQQLRDQDYEIVVCLGLSPFDAHCWVLTKEIVMEQWASGGIRSQHGGAAGSDTAWIEVDDPEDVPTWLRPCGGSLGCALDVLRRLVEH